MRSIIFILAPRKDRQELSVNTYKETTQSNYDTMWIKKMKKLLPTACLLASSLMAVGQCETWIGSDRESEATDAHSIYRDAYKQKDYDLAFEQWKIAYEIAPAADGKRDYHYLNGVELYKDRLAKATTDEDKATAKEMIATLYDQAIECYKNGVLPIKKCTGDDCLDKKLGYLYGRKAYDLYYSVNSPYSKTYDAVKTAVEYGGNDSEYIVFAPYAAVAVDWFKKEKMTAEETRAVYTELNEIADYNIAKGDQLSAYYEQAAAAMNASFREIENDIFDCAFFVDKLRPDYEDNPDDPETIKSVIAKLKRQGCPDSEPFLAELETKWKKYAVAENARLQAEFEANNPGAAAKKLYDNGDYEEAVTKYDEAISQEADPAKKASYLFSKASIQFRKLKKYGAARATAREAAKARPNWGRPYMLIGDMYGTTARNCGDAWNQRLAILAAMDKYSYAKSIDSSVAEEANSRLSRYRASMPTKDEGFMRKVSAGQSVNVGCWIGESVKVRYAN